MHSREDVVLRSQRVLKDDAVDKTVYKDIPQYARVGSPLQLEHLLYVLAGQSTGILSATKLAQQVGLSQPTIDKYILHLERSHMIFRLTNCAGSEETIQRRGRKCYFVDSAVRNATLQRGISPIHDGIEQGTLLENLAASSLHTLSLNEGKRLHYWRHKQSEVDLVYGHGDDCLAFEIASSPSHHRSGLLALVNQHRRFRGHAYLVAPGCGVRHAASDDSGIGTLPYETFLRCVGAQTRRAMRERLGW